MTIKLLWRYLNYGVGQLTNRYAQARLSDNPEQRDTADLSGSNASDTALVRRLVSTGASKLSKILSQYIEVSPTNADDTITEDSEWSYTFSKPLQVDGWALAGLMHWFIVRFAVKEWLKTFGFANEARLEAKELEDAEKELKQMLSESAMPVKDNSLYKIAEDVIEYIAEGVE